MIKKAVFNLIIFPLITFSFSCNQLFADDSLDQKWQNKIKGSVNFEFYNNDTYEADQKKDKYSENYLRSTIELDVKLAENLNLRSAIKLETIPQQSEDLSILKLQSGVSDRSYGNEGIFLGELNLNYDKNQYSLTGGKITVDFGTAWRGENNNIWLRDIPRNTYRQNEKLGFIGSLKAGNQKTVGQYLFSFSSFINDRKHLDNSIITKRDGASKSDARPGDDSGLSSYAASLNIKYDFGNCEELLYHFAYLNLAINERQVPFSTSKIADEKAWALNMNYRYPLNEDLLLDGLIEYVSFKNARGNVDNRTSFLTTNLVLNVFQDWSLIVGRSNQFDNFAAYSKTVRTTFETSIGYKFTKSSSLSGLKILAGYKQDSEDRKIILIRSRTYGLFVNYFKNF